MPKKGIIKVNRKHENSLCNHPSFELYLGTTNVSMSALTTLKNEKNCECGKLEGWREHSNCCVLLLFCSYEV